MKIFLSWSGETSHKVALALRDWLPYVIGSLEPYVSSEDIEKGDRWIANIAGELEVSNYGIICVTKDNIDAPWLNFEAGALSKSLDTSRVSPFLFRMKRSDILAKSPLTQFQSTIYEEEDFRKMVNGINKAPSTGEISNQERLNIIFDKFWPDLQKVLDSIAEVENSNVETVSDTGAILEELLQLARSQNRILHSPDDLIPRSYLNEVMHKGTDRIELFQQANSRLYGQIVNTNENILGIVEAVSDIENWSDFDSEKFIKAMKEIAKENDQFLKRISPLNTLNPLQKLYRAGISPHFSAGMSTHVGTDHVRSKMSDDEIAALENSMV